MLVENLPVPFDRRVWMEATTLRRAGYQVSVICPQGRDAPRWHERLEDVDVYRYPLPSFRGFVGHIVEYGIALLATLALSLVVLWRHGFNVIHSANPPDLFFLIAALYKPFGKRFVFDHHDLVPETCETRWSGLQLAVMRPLMRWCERATFMTADLVISTNESYRAVAIARGGKAADRVVVVRSGPLKSRFAPVPPDPTLRGGRRYLVCYLGVMGPNDGVHLLIEAAHTLIFTLGCHDVRFALMGSGDCFSQLVEQTRRLGLDAYVSFTGRIPDDLVIQYLSTADLGIAPDPKDALNDVSTMNKIVEYMAVGVPVLAFDLREARVSAGDAGEFADATDPDDLARRALALLENPERRRQMSVAGRDRFVNVLAWDHQAERLLGAYRRLLSATAPPHTAV
jgi:glycosyltransferase involved in cell wall biosynthesis